MKSIFPLALVLAVGGLARAADDKAVDPVGTWKFAYEIGGQKRTSTLAIKKDGDKLAGTMSWPDQKETRLSDLKLKEATLTFSAERKVMDNTFTVAYELTIDGHKFKGKGAVEAGGEKREFDIEGQREKDGDPVGLWKCEYEIGGQQRTSELTITKEGDKLAGTMSWPDQKEAKLKDVKFKEGELTFSAIRKLMDQEIAVDYKLAIDGDKLKGKGSAEFGGEKREFDIEGNREKAK